MPNCTATCATVTPQPGDSFIFRGGDVWHTANSSASPFIGTSNAVCNQWSTLCGWWWHNGWSGSPTSCNWPSTTSSCIYIGVDKTWYAGASWTRPAIDLDNPLSKSLVASCPYDEQGTNSSPTYYPAAISFGTDHNNSFANYIIFDGFEIYGGCSSSEDPRYINYNGTNDVFEELYLHGWTEASTGSDTNYLSVTTAQISNTYPNYNVWAYNVADGSDSYCISVNKCEAHLGATFYDNEHNICRWLAGCIGGGPNFMYFVHDNLFENMYEGWDPTVHDHVIHMFGNYTPAGTSIYFYNNTIRNTNDGITVSIDLADSGTIYFFNNVFHGVGNSGNCLAFRNSSAGSIDNAYFTNNTIDSPCRITAYALNGSGTQNWNVQNNHFIGFGVSSVSSIMKGSTGVTLNLTDNGNEVFQSEAVARRHGYTAADNYQPVSARAGTYHAGANLSSKCAIYSPDSALCRGSTGGVRRAAVILLDPILQGALPPLRGTAWDAGAYQFRSVLAKPVAPKHLKATVH